ncbi:uncharacterized protein LOC113655790 isoform X2 [Tachysurus fulvidraco]|uniref:uncharacterized protein LOC113655790 isoform X2 n=1 Tax=Tachysurus fulvidraco TaxID=1234273 RepID=UPI001FEDEC4C|nr:uncharacterized protein LOC113655790 isoform X2 [Tachysurus fulvidraco]
MPEGIWAWTLVLVLHCCSVLSQHSILAKCNEDISLPCSVSEQGGTYRYMVWYRNDTAIIKKKLNDVTFYNKSSPASLGVRDTLVLQNVQTSDSGYYQCFLAADVGQRDRQSDVSLTVSECVTVRPTWISTEDQCTLDVVEVSIMWSLLGFTLISISKVILCTIIVIVCKKQKKPEMRNRSRRQSYNCHKDRDKRYF